MIPTAEMKVWFFSGGSILLAAKTGCWQSSGTFKTRSGGLPTHLCREPCQPFAVQARVDDGEVGAQSVMVLRDAWGSHLVEAEDALQDAEHRFDFRPYFSL